MSKKILFFLIPIELMIIASLTSKIFKQTKNILGETSVNPIRMENIVFIQDNEKLKYFYEHRPNQIEYAKAPWINSEVKYFINSDGLNDTIDIEVSKSKETFRVLTLGDSFTFGEYVNTKENYPSLLEKLLNNNLRCRNIKEFQVINLGVPGYDIQYSVERFKLKGQKYNPDLVLWFLKDDDLRFINEIMIPEVNHFKEESKNDINNTNAEKGEYYPAWAKAEDELKELIDSKEILNLQRKYFNQFNTLYKGPLMIFTFPFTENIYKSLFKNFLTTFQAGFFYDGITNIYNEENTHFPDSHPTPIGYQIITQDLYNYLLKQNIIPCN